MRGTALELGRGQIFHTDLVTTFAGLVRQRLLFSLTPSLLRLYNPVLEVRVLDTQGCGLPSRTGRIHAACMGVGRVMDMAARA